MPPWQGWGKGWGKPEHNQPDSVLAYGDLAREGPLGANPAQEKCIEELQHKRGVHLGRCTIT